MVRTNYKWCLISLIFLIITLLCPDTYARVFNVDIEIQRSASLPVNDYFMQVNGNISIGGKAMDPNDEIGFFVKRDNGEWRLCGDIDIIAEGFGYKAKILSHNMIDENQNDTVDKVPRDGSILKIFLWDNSEGEKREIDPRSDEIEFISTAITNANGDFVYKKNNFLPNSQIPDPWLMNIKLKAKEIVLPDCSISMIEETVYEADGSRDWDIYVTCQATQSIDVVLTDGDNEYDNEEYAIFFDVIYAGGTIIAMFLAKKDISLPPGIYWAMIKNPDGSTAEEPDVKLIIDDNMDCYISTVRDLGSTWRIYTEGTNQETAVKLVDEDREEFDFASVNKTNLSRIEAGIPTDLPAGTYHTLLRNADGSICEYLQLKLVIDPPEPGVLVSFVKGMNVFGMPVEVDPYLTSYELMEEYFPREVLYSMQSYEYDYQNNSWSWKISYWDEYYNEPTGTPFNINTDKAYILYVREDKDILFSGYPLNRLNAVPVGGLKQGINLVNSSGLPVDYSGYDLLYDFGDISGFSGIAQFNSIDQNWAMAEWFLGNMEGTDFPLNDGGGFIIFIR